MPRIQPLIPRLLEALTNDVLDHNFDLQHLMRTIANSRAYQASFTTNEWNQNDRDNFSHATPRRLSAEELMDAVSSAAGARPHFPEVPQDTMAEQLVDPHIGQEGFLDVFGRPPRESSCECERRSDFSLPQALNLVNGKTISDAVADPKGRIAKLVLSGKGRHGHRRRAVPGVAKPPAERGGERARREVSGRRLQSRPRPGSVVGVAQQQGLSVHLLRGLCHAEHSRTSRLHLRGTHPARTDAHRLHRAHGSEPAAFLSLARPGQGRGRSPASTPARAAGSPPRAWS